MLHTLAPHPTSSSLVSLRAAEALIDALRTEVLAPIVAIRDGLLNRRSPIVRSTAATRLQQTSVDARALMGELYALADRPLPVTERVHQRLCPHAADRRSELRELAAHLHDLVLQPLLVATEELLEPRAPDPDAVAEAVAALDEAQRALRRALAGNAAGEEDTLVAAAGLRASLIRATARRGPAVQIEVQPGSESIHDALIVQIVREAYANAIRHADATTVSIAVSSAEDGVTLDVRDDGRGFDPERVRDAVRRGHIGLATITERVSAAGGDFRLWTSRDGGARLQVVLPPAPTPASGERPITVVLADDHPRYRETVAHAIARCPPLRIAAEVADGEQALHAILRLEPDVALIDLRMPRLDGLALLRRIRRSRDAPATRLIVMTADPDPALRQEVLAAGGDLLLDKASSRAEICAALLSVVTPAELPRSA